MILVADQNRASADLLVRRLRTEGWDAQAVGSVPLAQKVIDAAVARAILQAMVLDPALPGGGLELLRRLRLDANTAHLPVIVFGTSDATEDVANARRFGASAVMLKGRVTPSQLVGCLRTLLGGNPLPAAVPEKGEYFLWIQPGAGDAQRLGTDLGLAPGLRCRRCHGVLSLYLQRDPARLGEWLMAKVGCVVCARKRAAAQAPTRELQIEPVGGMT